MIYKPPSFQRSASPSRWTGWNGFKRPISAFVIAAQIALGFAPLAGAAYSVGHDANGNEVSQTDRAGRSTQMDYDALNRLVKTTYPDGTSDSSEYDAAGRVVASTDRLGVRTTVDYDAAGRQTATVNALGQRTSTSYDENGNRTRQTGTDGRVTRYEYDALNRLTQTTWPDGSTQRISYRTDNRKDSETDSRGTVTRYGWDGAGRLVSVSLSGSDNSNSATTTYGYDETAAKTTQTDALGRSTHWTSDGLGRITARQIQDGSQESSRYDSSGARIAKTSFAGEMQSWQYDSAGRAVAHSIPAARTGAPGASIRWNYSAAGELLSHSEQGTASLNGTQSYRYDANQALSSLSNPLGQLGYERDAAGQITQRSVSGSSSAGSASGTNATSTSRYVYNAAGQLVQVTASDGMVTRYGYDTAGRLVKTERQLGNGNTLLSHQGWDSADRLTSIAHVLQSTASAGTSTGAITSSSLIAGQSLTRAAGGAINRIDTYRAGSGDSSFDVATGSFAGTPAKTQQLEYDGQARLTRELVTTSAGSSDTRYDYDAVGNRSQKVVSDAAGSSTTRYSYDSADRLTQESISTTSGNSRVVNYGWDQNGNLSSKSEAGKTTLYRFDTLNRLIDIRTGATQQEASAAQPSVSYAYDAEGNRIKKSTASGLSSSYLIDPEESYAQVALEARSSTVNGVTAQSSVSYLRGLGLIRQSTTSDASANTQEVIYPLAGHLGTSLGAVDSSGAVVEQTDSDAFGNLNAAGQRKQTHLYTGEYWDEDSQLVYLRARWYDPVVGRFVSGDPFEGRQQDPRSLNRYAYAHGDPVQNLDPSGRMSLVESGVAQDIQSTLLTASTRVGWLINAYDKVNAVIGFVELLNSARKVFGETSFGGVDAYRSIGLPVSVNLSEAMNSAAINMPVAVGTGIGDWASGYARSKEKGNKLTAALIYMPLVSPAPHGATAGSIVVPTVARIKFGNEKIPVNLVFGGPSDASGTLAGIGLKMGVLRQLIRMDYHGNHSSGSSHGGAGGLGTQPGELSVIRDGGFHYHVRKWNQ